MTFFKGEECKGIGRISQTEELRLENAALKTEEPIDPFLQGAMQEH